MSTSLLYHGFSVQGYQHERREYCGGQMVFTISPERERLHCSRCESAHVERRGAVPRLIQLLPIGSKAVFCLLPVARVYCGRYDITRQVKVGFADEHRRYSRRFERYVLDLSRSMTIQAVSRYLGANWDVIKEIQWRHLEKHYARPKLKHLREIAIDEIHVGRNRFLTVVLDLRSGAVVFVGNGCGPQKLRSWPGTTPISTGPLKGTNKIRTIQRQGYGFRDIEFLKIMAIHETMYALVG